MDPYVGPEQQRVDEGFSLPHHPLRPHHVLLEGPVLLQDRELGWCAGQGQHGVLGGRKPAEGKTRQTETWRYLTRIAVQRAARANAWGLRGGGSETHRAPGDSLPTLPGAVGTALHPTPSNNRIRVALETEEKSLTRSMRNKTSFPPASSGSAPQPTGATQVVPNPGGSQLMASPCQPPPV